MEIMHKDVKFLASQANIALTNEEQELLLRSLRLTLAFLEGFDDEKNVSAANTVYSNLLRKDEVCKEFSRDEMLANAVTSSRDFFIVPRVMEDL